MNSAAVDGMRSASLMFDVAAGRAVTATLGLSSVASGAAEPPVPQGDLAEAMVGLITAQHVYTASAKILRIALENDRAVLDILA